MLSATGVQSINFIRALFEPYTYIHIYHYIYNYIICICKYITYIILLYTTHLVLLRQLCAHEPAHDERCVSKNMLTRHFVGIQNVAAYVLPCISGDLDIACTCIDLTMFFELELL